MLISSNKQTSLPKTPRTDDPFCGTGMKFPLKMQPESGRAVECYA